MKKTNLMIVTAIAALIFGSLPANAFENPRHPRILHTLASVDNVSQKVGSVVLTDDHALTIYERNETIPVVKRLSDDSYNSLSSLAMQLGDAKIVTHKYDVVCMMMPSPFEAILSVSPYDYHKGGFSSDLRQILSPEDCTRYIAFFPEDEKLHSKAQELKSILIILAEELLNQ